MSGDSDCSVLYRANTLAEPQVSVHSCLIRRQDEGSPPSRGGDAVSWSPEQPLYSTRTQVANRTFSRL